jgi:hypothetical protein
MRLYGYDALSDSPTNIKYQLLFKGDGKYWRGKEPFLDENLSNTQGKPTVISRGICKGYSMPIWSAGANTNEELYFRIRCPHRWDGVTNPWFFSISSITVGETVDDKYKFQLEWMSSDVGGVIPNTIIETITCEVTCSTGKNAAYYAQILAFEMNASTLVSGQCVQGRLRRINSSGPEVANEVAVFHWDTRWKMDGIGSDSATGY